MKKAIVKIIFVIIAITLFVVVVIKAKPLFYAISGLCVGNCVGRLINKFCDWLFDIESEVDTE